MHLSSPSCRVASKTLTLLFLSYLITSPLYQGSLATSCGQPRLSNDDKCTNWQCSRILYTSESPQLNTTTSSVDGLWSAVEPEKDQYGICVRGLSEGMECKVDSDCFIKQGLKCVQTVDKNNGSLVSHRCKKGESSKDAVVGYIGIVISCLAFGTMFVPAKRVKTGNGILFQFIMCGSILVVSICISLVTNRYIFYPRSMLGGMVWTIANSMAVPIVNLIGIGLGMTVWMGTKLLTGWGSGRFGWLGVKSEGEPHIPWLAYLGVFIGVVGILLFTLVKPALKKEKKDEEDSSAKDIANEQPVSDPQDDVMTDSNDKENELVSDPQDANINNSDEKPYSPLCLRVFGCVLSLTSGILYGINFNPSHSMMDYYVKLTLEDSIKPLSIQYSPDGLDYVLSASLGIFMTSSIITVMFYAIRTYLPLRFRNKLPQGVFGDEMNSDVVDVEHMLCPAFLSGGLWIIGQTAWFVANTNVGLTVSFPMISVGISVVVNIWAIFVFREIRGKKNFITMAAGFTCVIVTCFCTVFSNLE